MRRIVFVLLASFALLSLPVLATSAQAQPAAGPGTAAVKQANDSLSGLLAQKVAPGSPAEKALATKVTTAIRGFLDIEELGKSAMVNQWSKLTAAQQTEFLTVLRELIEANYIKGLRANVSYTVAYKGEAPDGANIRVKTEVTAPTKSGRAITIKLDYVVAKQGKNLRCVDIFTDEVGLVENYRAMFDKIIKDKGFAHLITTMKNKLASINAPAGGATPPASPAPPAKTPPAVKTP